MKKLLTLFVLCFCAIMANAQFDSAPAFPGAEGFGRYVTGGRGGKVIHVTNLNDSGTGSFRAAVSGDTKKIIVFDVAGVIALQSDLNIGKNTTVLGQTAPAPGITLRYYTVRPKGNSIIRYIRVRRGQEKNVNDGADAIWQREITGLIIDHCSFSWSIDEVASFYDNNNFTMQWCTIGESLCNAGHGKGAHGYGGIWGGKLASFHHNLLLHLNNRTPRFNGARYNYQDYTLNMEYNKYKWENALQAENVDFRNCVMFNWNGNGCYGGPGGGQINMVNNYYKAGPSTSNKTRVTAISIGNSTTMGSGCDQTFVGMTSRYYINGNYVTAASSPANYDWKGVIYDSGTKTLNGEYYTADAGNYYGSAVPHTTIGGVSCVKIKMDTPIESGSITTHTAQKAFDKVVSYAGASLHRDDVDERYAKETRSGVPTYTGSVTKKQGLVDVVADVNGYTEKTFGTGSREAGFDTDNDGIPDAWEIENGLNPNDASDALTYSLDKKGYYTNIEVYANYLVEGIVKAERADSQTSFEEYFPPVNSKIITPEGEESEGEDDPTDDDDKELKPYFTMVPSVAETATVSGGTQIQGSAFATVTGGSVYYQNNNNTAYNAVKGSKFMIGTNSCFFCITLSQPLKAGDVISFTNLEKTSNNNLTGIAIGKTATDKENFTPEDAVGDVDFVVPASLDGVSTIYLNRMQGKTTYFGGVTISRPASTGIANVSTMTIPDGAIYNLSGQRVDDSYKGIVIKNGKKYYQK